MNANAKKWIKALKSGDYLQGTGNLNYKDRYCCLGVLCEVAIANGVEVKKKVHKDGKVKYDHEMGYLPDSVREWVGLYTSEGSFVTKYSHPSLKDEDGDPVEVTALAEANDCGLTFKQVVKLIEEKEDELFAGNAK